MERHMQDKALPAPVNASPRLRDLVSSIPPAVERVVLKRLAKDPYQRFAHVQRFAYALKQASRY